MAVLLRLIRSSFDGVTCHPFTNDGWRLWLPRRRVSPDLRHTGARVSHAGKKASSSVGFDHVVGKGVLVGWDDD